MKNRIIMLRIAALLTCLTLPLASHARDIIAAPVQNTTEFHSEIGLTYASGVTKVADQMESNFGLVRDSLIPVGLRVSAYAKQSNGFGFGGGVGPCAFVTVEDRNHYYSHNSDKSTSYIIPLFVDVRYYFPRNGDIEPYVRAGVSGSIAGGDYLGNGSIGPVVAVGTQVWARHIVSIGVEAGYDGSKVKVKDGYYHPAADVRPVEFTFSVFARF
jgi:hypothetical protein